MTHRVIEVSSAPARLSIRNRQLMIERQDQEDASIPVEDIALLLLNNRGISLSHAVLTELPENKAAIIHCGAGHMPVSLSLPIAGNAVQGERLRYQLACSRPLRKRLWQQIIQAKIRMQGVVLAEFGLPPSGLKAMAGRVRSGDPDNLEAQAAQRYWPVLFGKGFKRDRYGKPPNNLLNYGYAIIRSAVARAICLAGLHPGIGLFHHNRANSFPLADDLMEVWRPLIDWRVRQLVGQTATDSLDQTEKKAILSLFNETVSLQGEAYPLGLAIQRLGASLARSLEERRPALLVPDGVIRQQQMPGITDEQR